MYIQVNFARIISVLIVVATFALLSPTLGSLTDVKNAFGYGAGLSVDNTTVLNGFAVADDSYTNGFKFRMRVTIDSALEDGLGLRFDDWARDGGGGAIPTSSNMLVNLSNTTAGAVSALNTYSTDLTVGTDADPVAQWTQKDVYIWLKVPTSTVGGAYSTSYGVRSTDIP